MSSILKSLKKLEEERTSTVDRAEQIARYAETTPRKNNRLKKTLLLLFCGVLIGVLSVGGWLLLAGKPAEENPMVAAPADVSSGKNSLNAQAEKETVRPGISAGEVSVSEPAVPSRETSLPQAAVSPPREPSSTSVVETPPREPSPPPIVEVPLSKPSPEPVTVAPPREPSPPPVAETPPRKQPSAPAAKAPRKTAGAALPPAIKTPEKSPVPVTSASAVPEKPESAAPAPPQPEVVEEVVLPDARSVAAVGKKTGSTPETSSLYKVTEIFYQDAGGGMAVLNDLPVMEGTTINGAMVDKILTDRVRLIIDGKSVDILLDANP